MSSLVLFLLVSNLKWMRPSAAVLNSRVALSCAIRVTLTLTALMPEQQSSNSTA